MRDVLYERCSDKGSENGLVSYDETKWGSCFMCVMNCPFGVLKADTATRTKVVKCDFCLQDGAEPNCVKACPKQAIYVARCHYDACYYRSGGCRDHRSKTIRSQQPDASITMISTDEHVHSRCMLHRYLSHERQEDTLSFVEPDFFETNKINWIKGVSVKTVDIENQAVLLNNGTSCHYDKLDHNRRQ